MDLATGVALATGVFLRLVFYFSGWCLAFCPDMYVSWLLDGFRVWPMFILTLGFSLIGTEPCQRR